MDTTFCAPGLLSPSSVLLKACSWQGPQSARFDDTRKSRFKQPKCCDSFVKFCQLGIALVHFESFWYTRENGGAMWCPWDGVDYSGYHPPKQLIIFPMRFWTLRLRHLSTYRPLAGHAVPDSECMLHDNRYVGSDVLRFHFWVDDFPAFQRWDMDSFPGAITSCFMLWILNFYSMSQQLRFHMSPQLCLVLDHLQFFLIGFDRMEE